MPSLSATLRAQALPTLAGAWRWWTSELRALLPSHLLLSLPGQSVRADIRPFDDRVEIVRTARDQGERLVEARPLAAFDDAAWTETAGLIAGRRTRVLLAFPQILWLTLKLPRAARGRLRAAVALQLRDHSPLEPALLDWTIGAVRIDGAYLHVEVAIVRTGVLDDIVRGFVDHAIAAPPIFAERDNGPPVLFRPGLGFDRARFAHLRGWWIAGLILLSTPLWALAVDTSLMMDARHKVERAETAARPRLAAERRLRDKAELGHALNAVLAAPSITALVEDLAQRLPETVHATEIASKPDGGVAFTLETVDPDSITPALAHDPLLPGVHQVDLGKTDDGHVRVRLEAAAR